MRSFIICTLHVVGSVIRVIILPRIIWIGYIARTLEECGVYVWIALVQDRNQWDPFVNMAMNLRV